MKFTPPDNTDAKEWTTSLICLEDNGHDVCIDVYALQDAFESAFAAGYAEAMRQHVNPHYRASGPAQAEITSAR